MKPSFRKEKINLADGQSTTVYWMIFDRSHWRPSLAWTSKDLNLCSQEMGIPYAISGSFFVHSNIMKEGERIGDPIGEFYLAGEKQNSFPFEEPWSKRRGAINIKGDFIEINRFHEIKSEPYDLLQTGPLLLLDGEMLDYRYEGFSEDRMRFDSDITAERHPRAAIGISDNQIVVFACDGRRAGNSGMYLEEVAERMREAGCRDALNLDGGGSVALIYEGQMQNHQTKHLSSHKRDHVPTPNAIFFQKR